MVHLDVLGDDVNQKRHEDTCLNNSRNLLNILEQFTWKHTDNDTHSVLCNISLPSPQRCKYLLHLILMHVCIKQEPSGPHRSHGKQFQSINTFAQSYDNTITLIKIEKRYFSPLQVRCFVLCLTEPGPVLLEKKILTFCQCIFVLSLSQPWKKAWPFIWTNLNSRHPRILCVEFGEISQSFCRRRRKWKWKRSRPFYDQR